MREILFRGRGSQNGLWIYGDLVHRQSRVDGKITAGISDECGSLYSIEPDTVSQFTGIVVKHGKKLFENDIFNLGDMNILYVVVWHDTGLRGKQLRSTSFVGLDYWKKRIEVVGNIFDNPELVEGI